MSVVAPLVGYQTTSAYVAAFRALTGVTPGRYFQRPAATPLPARRAEALAGADLSIPIAEAGPLVAGNTNSTQLRRRPPFSFTYPSDEFRLELFR